MSAVVSPVTAATITHRAVMRQLLTRGRLVTMAVLAIAMVVVAGVVGSNNSGDPEALDAGANLLTVLGLGAIVPISCLVFAGASLGDARDDGTLVYLWLRPMGRSGVVAGAYLAAVTVALPFNLVAVGVSAAMLGAGSDLVVAALLSSALAVLAYCSVFVGLGLIVRNSVVWGLIYILVWEGLVAGAGTIPARLAIRGYSRSILGDVIGLELASNDVSTVAGVVALLVIAVAGCALATVRLNRMSID